MSAPATLHARRPPPMTTMFMAPLRFAGRLSVLRIAFERRATMRRIPGVVLGISEARRNCAHSRDASARSEARPPPRARGSRKELAARWVTRFAAKSIPVTSLMITSRSWAARRRPRDRPRCPPPESPAVATLDEERLKNNDGFADR